VISWQVTGYFTFSSPLLLPVLLQIINSSLLHIDRQIEFMDEGDLYLYKYNVFFLNIWKIYQKSETKFSSLDIRHKWNNRATI